MKQSAAKAGVQYVDIGEPLAHHAELVAAESVQPNSAGHQAIADAVLAKIGGSSTTSKN